MQGWYLPNIMVAELFPSIYTSQKGGLNDRPFAFLDVDSV